MSRRASNSVKLARERLARFGTRLDRNGIPVLDDPRQANRLPRRCAPGTHEFVEVYRKTIGYFDEFTKVVIESKCRLCDDRINETRTVIA